MSKIMRRIIDGEILWICTRNTKVAFAKIHLLLAELGPQHNIPQHLDGGLKAPAVHTRRVQESVPGALAVADASILLQQLQDLVLAAELGGGVKCQLLQVMGDSRGEGHLIPAKIFDDVY